MDAVDLKLIPTIARCLFSTVEWFEITVATFHGKFLVNSVPWSVFYPPPAPPSVLLQPTHPHAIYARPEISSHMKQSA